MKALLFIAFIGTLIFSKPVADCTTVKSGDYNDPTVWSCGVVPDSTKSVSLTFPVNITANQSAKSVDNQSLLNFTGNYIFYIKGGI